MEQDIYIGGVWYIPKKEVQELTKELEDTVKAQKEIISSQQARIDEIEKNMHEIEKNAYKYYWEKFKDKVEEEVYGERN